MYHSIHKIHCLLRFGLSQKIANKVIMSNYLVFNIFASLFRHTLQSRSIFDQFCYTKVKVNISDHAFTFVIFYQ